MITSVIFDLDCCLSDAREPGTALFQPVFDAIIRANAGALSEEALQLAVTDMWRFPYDYVAHKHAFTPAMLAAGWNELLQIEVTTPMSGYGDLHVLGSLPTTRFLVTSGFRRLQESKIRALGIRALFAGVYVDAIDEPGPRGKERLFAEILHTHGLSPGEVLVVGDNPDSELAAGRRLGMRTVQTLRPGVPFSPNANFHIGTLHELVGLIAAG